MRKLYDADATSFRRADPYPIELSARFLVSDRELIPPCRQDGSLLSADRAARSEEHTSELQSLMRISYAVFCLKKKKTLRITTYTFYQSRQYIWSNNKYVFTIRSIKHNK